MMKIYHIIYSALVVIVSALWAPLFWVVLLPIAFSLPHRTRIASLIATGLMLDLLSGHLFGLGVLALLFGELVVGTCDKIFNPGTIFRSVFALIGSIAALLLLAFSHIFVEMSAGTSAGLESFSTWFRVVFPNVIIALILGTLISSQIRPKRDGRFLLSGI